MWRGRLGGMAVWRQAVKYFIHLLLSCYTGTIIVAGGVLMACVHGLFRDGLHTWVMQALPLSRRRWFFSLIYHPLFSGVKQCPIAITVDVALTVKSP